MEKQGVDPLGGTPAEFARFIDDELKKWAGVVKAAGIKNDRLEIGQGRNSTMRGLKRLGSDCRDCCCGCCRHPPRGRRAIIRTSRSASWSAFTPGSVADITARVLGNRMGQILGQQVVVENKPGAGSNLAAEFVARAPKDGYTLFLPGSANVANAAINPNLPFDIAKDFAPIALVNAVAVILVVHPSLGVNNVQELIALAKSKPGELTYASTGIGSAPHFSGELFMQQHRHQARARALSGQPAGGDRSARRPRPGDVLAGHGRDLAGPGRQAQGAGVGRQQARRHPARRADHDRGRHAGLRHRDLVRPDGARGHAARAIDKLSRAVREAVKSNEVIAAWRPRASIRSTAGPKTLPASWRASSSAGATSRPPPG